MTRRRRGARPHRRSGAEQQQAQAEAAPPQLGDEDARLLERSRAHLDALASPDHSHRLISDDLILEALRKTGGRVWGAARLLRISPRTIWRRIAPEQLDELRRDAVEEALDVAEIALQQRIAKGDWKALRFFLLTRGKSRGYVFGRDVQVSGVVAHLQISELLQALDEKDGWHEFARSASADRDARLLGDERLEGAGLGDDALEARAAPAGDRPARD